MNARQQQAQARKLAAHMDRMSRRHRYGYNAQTDRYYVRKPDIHGGGTVCELHGVVGHPETIEQAEAICAALDRLSAKLGEAYSQ